MKCLSDVTMLRRWWCAKKKCDENSFRKIINHIWLFGQYFGVFTQSISNAAQSISIRIFHFIENSVKLRVTEFLRGLLWVVPEAECKRCLNTFIQLCNKVGKSYGTNGRSIFTTTWDLRDFETPAPATGIEINTLFESDVISLAVSWVFASLPPFFFYFIFYFF